MNLLISFGPLKAYIDEVRFITNRSTGTFGYKLLQEALLRKYNVRAVVGCMKFPAPKKVDRWIKVEEYKDLKNALYKNFSWADVLIMAAAVPDFVPQSKSPGKIPRSKGKLHLKLEATESIIGALSKENGRNKKVLIGFSLEKDAPIEKAYQKVIDNDLDFTVAVSLSSEQNPYGLKACSVALASKSKVEKLPLWSKQRIARHVFDNIAQYKDGLRKR
ncbi:MAG: phosphopantothenoylcysteine decarboxylase [Candidatus Saelkia tenebricola]|nr:phosphopantothenoylcysteine decarboxylase [Candidatus Saelkia tenebricola]